MVAAFPEAAVVVAPVDVLLDELLSSLPQAASTPVASSARAISTTRIVRVPVIGPHSFLLLLLSFGLSHLREPAGGIRVEPTCFRELERKLLSADCRRNDGQRLWNTARKRQIAVAGRAACDQLRTTGGDLRQLCEVARRQAAPIEQEQGCSGPGRRDRPVAQV